MVFKVFIRIKCFIYTGSSSEESADVVATLALIWNVNPNGSWFGFMSTVILLMEGCDYGLFYKLFGISVERG